MNGIDIPDAEWTRLRKDIEAEVGKTFAVARPETPLCHFGIALNLLAMLESEKFGKDTNKTLKDYDREARGVLLVRKPALERLREKLGADEEIRESLEKARQRVIYKRFHRYGGARLREFARFLSSDAFAAEVDRLGTTRGAKRLETQMLRLASVDRRLSEKVADHWAAKGLAKDPAAVLRRIPREDAERALEQLLLFLSKLPAQHGAMKNGIPCATTSAKLLSPAASFHEGLLQPHSRKAIARSLAAALHSPQLRDSFAQLDDAAMIARLKANNVLGADVVERFTESAGVGRGVTTLLSLWGLWAVGKGLPLLDDSGNVRWDQLTASTTAALGIASTLPDIRAFCKIDVPKLWAVVTANEMHAARVANSGGSAGAAAQVMKHGIHFKALCDSLGLIGDVISIVSAFNAVGDERQNEDRIGELANLINLTASVCGFTLAIFAACGMAFPPAALGFALVGIASAMLDAKFGESALTGKIRQDLRELGITDTEESVHDTYGTRERTVTKGYGAYMGGGSCTITERYPLPNATVRSNIIDADLEKKIKFINQQIDGKTVRRQEELVLGILSDTRCDSAAFIRLVEATDPWQLADELENNEHAIQLMMWTTGAYAHLGQRPGAALNEQFLCHCKFDRWKVLVGYFQQLGRSGPPQMRVYDQMQASVLEQGLTLLMNGRTPAGEEWAMQSILSSACQEQLDDLVKEGQGKLLRRLRSEMTTERWGVFHKRLRSPKAAPQTKTWATMVQ